MEFKQNISALNNNGQAMVETLLSTVFLIIITFAALQLVIMVVNDLIMNEAVFALSRVAVVSKKDDVKKNTFLASAVVLATQAKLNGNNITFAAYDVPVDGRDVPGSHSGTTVQIYNSTVKYIQSVMFGYLFSGPQIMSIGNTNVLKCASRARMVKSPDEDYYDKAYNGAPNFQ